MWFVRILSLRQGGIIFRLYNGGSDSAHILQYNNSFNRVAGIVRCFGRNHSLMNPMQSSRTVLGNLLLEYPQSTFIGQLADYSCLFDLGFLSSDTFQVVTPVRNYVISRNWFDGQVL